jgi:chorismate mutase
MNGPRRLRAIRGATTVEHDDPREIADATAELVREIASRNALGPDDVVSAFFTMTPDLASGFPATAAREALWGDVPMLCTMEVPVAGALPRCIRVLVHVETTRPREGVRHVYLRAARKLRPDIADDTSRA